MAGSSPAMTIACMAELIARRDRDSYRRHVAAEIEEFLRVLRLAVDDDLVMRMRTGRAAGRAEIADLLVQPDPLPDRHGERMQMRVARGDAVAVIDLDDLAVIVAIPGIGHDARRGRKNR